jgi:hypothetical protein
MTRVQCVLVFVRMNHEKRALFIEMVLRFWGRLLENNKIERYVIGLVQPSVPYLAHRPDLQLLP